MNKSILRLTKRFRYLASCAVCACLLFPAQSSALTDEELQIALLLKVAQFTQWPQQYNQKFKFCLYRGKGYEALKDQTDPLPKVGPNEVRFLFLKQNTPAHLINQCHLLFITEGSATETKQILQRASYAPTLTISPLKGFANLGGMIELIKQEKRYNFRINLSPVSHSKLIISAPLLEISNVIKGDN